MRAVLLLLTASLTACASKPPDPDPVDLDKQLLKQPETLYRFWATALHNRQFDNAHACLSAAAKRRLSVEEFSVAMTSYGEIRRMMEEARVHAIDVDRDKGVGTLRVCNPEFGLTAEYKIVHEFKNIKGGIWSFDLSREEIEQLTGKVLGWYGSRDPDGRKHVYPPDYKHHRASDPCPCGGAEIEG